VKFQGADEKRVQLRELAGKHGGLWATTREVMIIRVRAGK